MSRTAIHSAARMNAVRQNEAWWPEGDANRPSAPRHRKPARYPAGERGYERYTEPFEPELRQPEPRQPEPRRDARGAITLSRLLMYATVALLMALLFAQIGRLAQIAAQTKRISALQSSIREMQNEQSNLLVRLSMQQNINRVHDEAIYKLGMIHPEDGQIRVISLNGSSVNARTQTADNALGAGPTE